MTHKRGILRRATAAGRPALGHGGPPAGWILPLIPLPLPRATGWPRQRGRRKKRSPSWKPSAAAGSGSEIGAGRGSHWPGLQIGLGHAEGRLNLPQVVIRADHRCCGHLLGAGDLQEPRLLQRRAARAGTGELTVYSARHAGAASLAGRSPIWPQHLRLCRVRKPLTN